MLKSTEEKLRGLPRNYDKNDDIFGINYYPQ